MVDLIVIGDHPEILPDCLHGTEDGCQFAGVCTRGGAVCPLGDDNERKILEIPVEQSASRNGVRDRTWPDAGSSF